MRDCLLIKKLNLRLRIYVNKKDRDSIVDNLLENLSNIDYFSDKIKSGLLSNLDIKKDFEDKDTGFYFVSFNFCVPKAIDYFKNKTFINNFQNKVKEQENNFNFEVKNVFLEKIILDIEEF